MKALMIKAYLIICFSLVVISALRAEIRSHEVSKGETLFSISRKYNVPVDSIKRWNALANNDLSLGQSLQIQSIQLNQLLPTLSKNQHQVAKGETLYSISKKYKVSVDALIDQNNLRNAELQLHQIIEIPTKESVKNQLIEKQKAKKSYANKYHSVQTGETLYSISKSTGISIEQLKQWNKIENTELRLGQELIIGTAQSNALFPIKNNVGKQQTAKFSNDITMLSSDTVINAEKPLSAQQNWMANIYKRRFDDYDPSTLERHKGVSNFLDESIEGEPFIALFNDAEIGSVVQVRNLLNNQTTYVKVVGRLPKIKQNEGVAIKISAPASKALYNTDERFLIEVIYAQQNTAKR